MARARKTNVKAHKRKTSSGVVRVKAHCRRPPQSAWRKSAQSAAFMGW